ncbi:MAG TPA: tetratricopeptide repeat protein, partial [Bacteroidales bacterium]|nr:tetratricopeptide repeat protein [Bacteroidales bacterium]
TALWYSNLLYTTADGLNNSNFIANSFYINGKVKSKQDQYNEAINEFKKAYEYYAKSNNILGQMAALNNIGCQYVNLKQYKKAHSELSKTYKIQKKLLSNNSENLYLKRIVSITLRNDALSLNLLGKSKKAIPLFQKALEYISNDADEIAARRRALIYNDLANIYNKQGKTELFTEYKSKTAGMYLPVDGEEGWINK